MVAKPYQICWIAIIVLALIGFTYRTTPLDIQLYDTYFIVGAFPFVLIGSIMLFLVGLGYWVLARQGKQPNRFLTLTHLAFTIGVLWLVLPVTDAADKSMSIGLFWAVLAFVTVQGGFLIYLFVSLLRR